MAGVSSNDIRSHSPPRFSRASTHEQNLALSRYRNGTIIIKFADIKIKATTNKQTKQKPFGRITCLALVALIAIYF